MSMITQNVTLRNAYRKVKYKNATKFNPGLALTGLSGTGHWSLCLLYVLCYFEYTTCFSNNMELHIRSGLSLRAGGRGFPPATMSVAPGYFYWKIEEN